MDRVVNVAELLDRRAAEAPQRVAIVEPTPRGERTITFGELRDAAAAVAARLASRGLEPGDRVLLLTPMGVRLYVALVATLRVGAVTMVVDPGLGLRAGRAALRIAPPKAVLGGCRALALSRLVPELVAARRVPVPRRAGGASVPLHPRTAEDAALLTFTSGSTGPPKAVVRSHGLLLAQQAALAPVLGSRPGEVSLATLPIFVLANLAAGVTSVIADADLRRPAQARPGPLAAQVDRHRPTSTVAAPALLERLAAGAPTHRLARVFTGGAPVFPVVLDALAPLASDGRVTIVYGSTEAEPIAHLATTPQAYRALATTRNALPVGVPVDAVRLRILDTPPDAPLAQLSEGELDARTLEPGGVGEIVVAGAHVVPGYLDGAGDPGTKIRVGDRIWHRTGDAGFVDPDGGLWLLGRHAAAVRGIDGRAVHPLVVELALRERTRLRGTAIDDAGVPTLVAELGGARPSADVARELRRLAAEHGLAAVQLVDALPLDRRHQGKIDHRRLVRARRRPLEQLDGLDPPA